MVAAEALVWVATAAVRHHSVCILQAEKPTCAAGSSSHQGWEAKEAGSTQTQKGAKLFVRLELLDPLVFHPAWQ